METAGGVGGLLMQRDHTSGAHHFVGYDGNGNVTALVSGSDSSVTGIYEYGPFGEAIRATGAQAKLNPFRWSTKFTDDQTELVYYGYRYYSANLGINRDPMEEDGGIGFFAATPRCSDPLKRLNELSIRIASGSDLADCSNDDGTNNWGYTWPNDGKREVFLCPMACRMGRWCLAETIIHELLHERDDDASGRGPGGAFDAEKACGLRNSVVVRSKPDSAVRSKPE